MDRLQGAHSVVYALVMFMAALSKPANEHLTTFVRSTYSRTGCHRARIVSAYYSDPPKDLIRRCRSKLGKDRPDAHVLQLEIKERMEHYRAAAYAAEEDSRRSKQLPRYLFHEKSSSLGLIRVSSGRTAPSAATSLKLILNPFGGPKRSIA